jgi:hypothetical protein
MRYLSYQIIFLLFTISIFAQSPHGDSFDLDCSECHSADSWKIDLTQISFDHSKTNFALIGQHINVDCKSCHESLVFSKMDKDCFSCHKDIHQGTVGLDCASCHTPTTWIVKDIIGLHQKGRFPLLGAHQTADCAQCHSGYPQLNFEPLNIDCYTCHKQNYESTQNPNHIAANFSTECQDCHNISALSWNATNIDHSFFPLVGGHALPSCFSCHQQGGNFSGLSNECYSCHQQNYEATQNPNHIAAGIPTTCDVCHSIQGWTPADFNHNLTAFPLTGKHIDTDCSNCHEGGYTGTPTDCYSCHQQDYQSTNDPNHVASQFPTDCSLCHTTAGWDNATFDHNQSNFPLTGAHTTINCQSCHQTGYTGTPTDCWSCHQSDYQSTTDPNHVSGNYPQDCTVCHNTSDWGEANFDHNITQFPLTGAHTSATCQSCHQSGYTGTSTDCYACHTTDYNNTANPNHIAANFPTTCVDCHSTAAWAPATFDHDNQYFPIYSEKHAGKWNQCSECHTVPNNYSSFSCIDCHDHNRTDTDNQHQAVQRYVYNSADCFSCHPQGSSDGAFNHATSSFPLTGLHLTASCEDCHQNGYAGTSAVCSDCHLAEYNSAVNPNHQTLSISTDCGTCHTPAADWQPSLFPQHDQVYQLLGRHSEIANDCASCHNGNYTTTQNQCVGCHQNAYNAAVNPNHSSAGISTECSTCHNSNGWVPSTFDHSTTGFELIGSHQPLQCSGCHNGTTAGLTSECLTCHQTDYNAALNHTAQFYPTNCEQCHNSVNWNEATFDHQNTNFPLTGAHINSTCQSCHQSGYTNTPTDCYACHTTDFNNTANPDHQTAGIPTTCVDCHSTTAWQPATFDHQNTNFPLTGAHTTTTCQSCHQSGYTNTPTDCVACHTTDYNNTTNPNHIAASFPTTCVDCHSTTAWEPATFDHDNQYFPIYSGAHNGKWNLCSECHTTPNNYSLFSCIDCHEHNQTDMNQDHQGVNGYVYNSLNCYDCHPDGQHRPVVFNHTATEFPLTGAHINVECAQCHSSKQDRISVECVACHMQDYLKSTNPNHQATGISTDCISCHSTNNWSSGIKLFEDGKVFQ